jgi:hypothetical protein
MDPIKESESFACITAQTIQSKTLNRLRLCRSPGWVSQCDVFIMLRLPYHASSDILAKIEFVMVAVE